MSILKNLKSEHKIQIAALERTMNICLDIRDNLTNALQKATKHEYCVYYISNLTFRITPEVENDFEIYWTFLFEIDHLIKFEVKCPDSDRDLIFTICHNFFQEE